MQSKLLKTKCLIDDLGKVVVCYSGGVDSALLLRLCVEQLGDHAIAIIADSPSLPRSDLQQAKELAVTLGATVEVVATDELADPRFFNNPHNRCYFCKGAMMRVVSKIAKARHATVVFGTNADDLSEHRPGLRAANEANVRHPLAEAGLTKTEIRQISRDLGLPTWDKPEQPCLASRFPYGTQITTDRLRQVEQFEQALTDLGFSAFRVRYHGPVARIEFATEQIAQAVAPDKRSRIVAAGKNAGFSFVTADLTGYRRGALNEVLDETARDPDPEQVTKIRQQS